MVEAEPSWEECMELLDQLPVAARRGAGGRHRAADPQQQPGDPRARVAHRRRRGLRRAPGVLPARGGRRRPAQRRSRDAQDAGRRALSASPCGCCATPTPTSSCRRCSPSATCATCARSSRCARRSTTRTPTSSGGAIEAVGKLGDARAIPDLLPFLEGDSWLQLATMQALGDLRSPAAVRRWRSCSPTSWSARWPPRRWRASAAPRPSRRSAAHWLRFRDEARCRDACWACWPTCSRAWRGAAQPGGAAGLARGASRRRRPRRDADRGRPLPARRSARERGRAGARAGRATAPPTPRCCRPASPSART